MALDDAAVLIPGTGAIWTGTVGSATKPTVTDLAAYVSAGTVPAGWTSIGHTSLDDLPAPGQDGGDTTTKSTWQANPLRTTIAPVTDFIDVKALQVLDNEVLGYYFGGGDATVANEFALPDSPVGTEKACTLVWVDGTTPLGWYYPKTSIYRGDAIGSASDDFMNLPLRITILKLAGQKKGIWINDKLGI